MGELADQVVGSGRAASTREHRSYLADVRSVVAGSSSVGVLVGQVRDGTAAVGGRVALTGALDRALAGARAGVATLASIGAGAPSASTEALLSAVFADRARAVAELGRGVDLAIGVPGRASDAASAVSALLAAGALAERADTAYRAWARAVRHTAGGSAPAVSQWIADAGSWRAPAVGRWAAVLAGDRRLAAVPALRIVSLSMVPSAVRIEGLPATTVPPSTTTTTVRSGGTTTTTTVAATAGGRRVTTTTVTTTTLPPTSTTEQLPPPGSVSVLPPTGTLAIVAVVSNPGNVADAGVELTATVTGSSPGRTRSSPPVRLAAIRHRRIGGLAAGAARYVTLRPVRVHLGGVYRIVVAVTAPGAAVSAVDRVDVTVAAA